MFSVYTVLVLIFKLKCMYSLLFKSNLATRKMNLKNLNLLACVFNFSMLITLSLLPKKFTEILGITKDNLKTEVIKKSTMLKIYGTLDESNGNKFLWENSDVYFTRSKK